MPSKIVKTKQLKNVGIWATIWWAVSCLYILILVWATAKFYSNCNPNSLAKCSWSDSFTNAVSQHAIYGWLFILIILAWAAIGFYWVIALKNAKIDLKDGLKDLFLTIR